MLFRSLGTIFTLLVIPSLYVLIAKQHVGEDQDQIASDFAPVPENSHA